ncbi:MAG TPA: VWA domain-containing protein [Vicinamibacterales bacterium]|nr:VWA domain-containing protein [Vicinamibacterales bacterium]
MTGSVPVAAIAAVTAAIGVVAAQNQPPTFGTTTRTVAVYATVTDARGRLAADLTRDDFEIDDNGAAQPITVFSNDIQPITVIMLLDRSGSMKPNFDLETRAAETFVHGMLPVDRARIGTFGKDIQIEPDDFTSDRDGLFKILHGDLQKEGPTPLWNAVDRAIDKLLLEKGRRIVLPFSDGVDEPLDFSGHAKSLKDEMKRAEDNDIMVYAIGMEGEAPMQQQRAIQGFGGRGIMVPRRNDPPQMQKPDEGMARIAAATGGGYFELTSPRDIATGAFDRVADELHHQYALGFVPQKLDGRLHDLTVKVIKPGYSVRARKRYLAPKA